MRRLLPGLVLAGLGCGSDQEPSRVPASFEVTPAPVSVPQRQSLQLVVHVLDASGAVIQDPVTFAVADTTLVTVSPAGVLTSPGPVGATTITVASGAIDTVLPVSVAVVTTELRVTPSHITMGVGTSRQLTAELLDATGAPLPDADITFETTDPTRATVTADGLVRYVGVGSAAIRVTAGGRLAIIGYRGMRSGHPVGTPMSPATIPGGDFGVAVDQDGQVLVARTGGFLQWGDYPVSVFDSLKVGGLPTSVAVLGGRRAIITPTGDDTTHATVVDLDSHQPLASVQLGVAAHVAAVSGDSATVYLGTDDGRVLVLDAGTLTLTDEVDLGVPNSRANHLAFNGGETRLYASSYTTSTVSVIDLGTRTVSRTIHVGASPQGIAVSPGEAELYVARDGSNTIEVWDLAADTLLTSLDTGALFFDGPFGLALSPDGAVIYAGVTTGNGHGLIQVVDVASRSIVQTITSCGGVPRRVAFGFAGGLAVVIDELGCVNFIE
jgi:YVTN family beta-propeller protein